jgi:ribosomal protein S18 acetylase RimI-like enzyme
MSLADFIALHTPALERDEVRHNLILAIMQRALKGNHPLLTWTLGEPGACAIKWPGRAIILGDVTPEQARAFAEQTRDLAYEGVVGLEDAPDAFAARARDFGIGFAEPVNQRIHALHPDPVFPQVQGVAREVRAEDGQLLGDWLQAFEREAVPEDPPTPRAALEAAAGEGRHMFWTVAGTPVSVAGIARRVRTVAAIAPVYTPPEQRGRGFAAAVTAAVAARLFSEGYGAVCLYTNLANSAANRCYAKIGFRGVCESRLYYRR